MPDGTLQDKGNKCNIASDFGWRRSRNNAKVHLGHNVPLGFTETIGESTDMTSVQLNIVVGIVTLVIGVLCLIDLWNKKCSFARRLFWSPVPFIPLLGPMLYYALFEPPAVQKNASSELRDTWTGTSGGGNGAFGGGFGGFGGSFGGGFSGGSFGGGGGSGGGGGASGGW
jgi:hypothetical protein